MPRGMRPPNRRNFDGFLRKLDQFHNFLLGLFDAGYLVEGDVGFLAGMQLGARLAERQDAACATRGSELPGQNVPQQQDDDENGQKLHEQELQDLAARILRELNVRIVRLIVLAEVLGKALDLRVVNGHGEGLVGVLFQRRAILAGNVVVTHLDGGHLLRLNLRVEFAQLQLFTLGALRLPHQRHHGEEQDAADHEPQEQPAARRRGPYSGLPPSAVAFVGRLPVFFVIRH